MKLAVISAHIGADSLSESVMSWRWFPTIIIHGGSGMMRAYEDASYSIAPAYDLLAFFHDDLIIHDERWPFRVIQEFDDPRVGLVGFGGGLGHGDPDIYQKPYDYHQLARHDFISNMTDAESHGRRFTDSHDVAVLDGFSLIFRRSVLEKIGGWHPESPAGYIGYDYAACCRVRRAGYKIRMVGVSCTHLGGRSFVKLGLGKDPKHWEQYLAAHEYCYKEFKDVLPCRIPRQ
jgi:Glycosyltransferase like family